MFFTKAADHILCIVLSVNWLNPEQSLIINLYT